MNSNLVKIGDVTFGGGAPLALIAGPCVIEDEDLALKIAEQIAELGSKLNIGVVFKASFDKANRTSVNSYRGPGIKKGLQILSHIKKTTGLPVLTDIHIPEQAAVVAEVVEEVTEATEKVVEEVTEEATEAVAEVAEETEKAEETKTESEE